MHSYIHSPIVSEHEFIHFIGDAKIACSLRQGVKEGQRQRRPNRGMIGRIEPTKVKNFFEASPSAQSVVFLSLFSATNYILLDKKI
jgi:hypothetical protein